MLRQQRSEPAGALESSQRHSNQARIAAGGQASFARHRIFGAGQTLPQAQRYSIQGDLRTAEAVLTVTVENGRLFIRENEEEKQEYIAESPNDFYSATSTDKCSFKREAGPAQAVVLHLDNGQNPELKRVP